MKSTERHHLKQNDIERLTVQATHTLEARRREIIAGLVIVVVLLAAGIGYFVWRERTDGRAYSLLADALAVEEARVGPPAAPGTPSPSLSFPTERERAQAALTKFKIAADAYPASDAGIFARYKQAANHMTLADPAAAAAAYQDVIKHAGGGDIHGQMARLGLAEAQARSGQFDQAINTFKEMAQRKDGPLPVDGILMQLGRTYINAGKRTEAQQTFTRLVEEYPESPFNADAKKELEGLKKT
jgi:TolA-binding protein